MPKRRPETLSVDQAIYLLMNGDLSDVEIENLMDNREEKNSQDRKNDECNEFSNVLNEESSNPSCISIGKNSVEIEIKEQNIDERKQENVEYSVSYYTDSETIDAASCSRKLSV